jgi:FKBP-type peptidyl-prolyl cis-trans isomerase
MTKTASGLMYEVLVMGKGPKPTAENTVSVNYEGTLIDGTIFDSSYERGEPATFPLNGVIRGWTEGLQLMPIGSTFRFIIPADLAYGNNPPPSSSIQPGSTLVFKVELLKIEKK